MSVFSIILGFIQLLTILFIFMFEYKNNFTSLFIWATLLMIFGLPHFFTTLVGHNYYSIEVINEASIFVILFNLIYLLMKFFLKATVHKNLTYGFESDFINIKTLLSRDNTLTKSNERFVNICLVLLIVMFIIIYKMMGGFKGASWGKYFSFYSKGYGNIMLYFVYIFYAISGVALVYIKNGYKIKAIIAILMIIFTAIITNTKMMFIAVFLLFLAPLVFNEKNKFSAKKILLGVISLICVLYIINFFYILRAHGNINNLVSSLTITEINAKIIDMIANSKGELGVRNAFYLFIDNNNNFENFNKGHTYIRLLMMGIPSKYSFNLKPPDFAVSMGSAYLGDMNNTRFSMHPTFYGDSFANFWWWGIFLGIFWALLTHIIDKFIHSRGSMVKDMLMVSICTCYVMIGRGSVYNSCITIVASVLIVLSIDFFSRIRV